MKEKIERLNVLGSFVTFKLLYAIFFLATIYWAVSVRDTRESEHCRDERHQYELNMMPAADSSPVSSEALASARFVESHAQCFGMAVKNRAHQITFDYDVEQETPNAKRGRMSAENADLWDHRCGYYKTDPRLVMTESRLQRVATLCAYVVAMDEQPWSYALALEDYITDLDLTYDQWEEDPVVCDLVWRAYVGFHLPSLRRSQTDIVDFNRFAIYFPLSDFANPELLERFGTTTDWEEWNRHAILTREIDLLYDLPVEVVVAIIHSTVRHDVNWRETVRRYIDSGFDPVFVATATLQVLMEEERYLDARVFAYLYLADVELHGEKFIEQFFLNHPEVLNAGPKSSRGDVY